VFYNFDSEFFFPILFIIYGVLYLHKILYFVLKCLYFFIKK